MSRESYLQYIMCGGKKRYTQKKTAKRATIKMGHRYGGKYKFYHCNQCDGYHLTKTVNYIGGNNGRT